MAAVRQYASTSVCQYVSMLCYLSYINPNKLHSLDPRNYLFNGQEEGDYLLGQGIINEASIDDKEYLQLYEPWCVFAYRDFYKNLLVILDEISLHTFGGKKQVFQTDFANSLICMMIKNTCIFDEAIRQHLF
jgi:hypothetical protein